MSGINDWGCWTFSDENSINQQSTPLMPLQMGQ
jgi:hypothetical protein